VSHPRHSGLVYARRPVREGNRNVTILMHRVIITARMGLTRPLDKHMTGHAIPLQQELEQMIASAAFWTCPSKRPCFTSENPKFLLTGQANQLIMRHLDVPQEFVLMSDQSSELVELSKLNGDFRRNYGKVLGAFLYLRSVSSARGRSWFWAGLVSFACSVALAWLARHGRTM